MDRCPFCQSSDLVEDGVKVTCVACESNAISGRWASSRAIRAAQRAQASVRTVFDA